MPNPAQTVTLQQLCARAGVLYEEHAFEHEADTPPGAVSGWVADRHVTVLANGTVLSVNAVRRR